MTMEQYETLDTVAPALFGRVDRCRHRTTGDLVAVKRMELALAGRRSCSAVHDNSAPVREDVFAELQTNLKVQALGGHPFVLPMRDAFVDAGAVHLVLAYCARGELLAIVNAQRATLSLRRKLRYFKQVALAASFLHANGIAHRDLSLENVLVDARDCCQVCDFGLSTSAPMLASSPVGKLHYLAPEACGTDSGSDSDSDSDSDGDTFDPTKADVWSLGVMLFAMLAGRYPFREPLRRDDHFRLLADFGAAYLLAKLDVDTESAPEVADLLAQLLELDPAKRPSAAALLQHHALADIDCEPVEPPTDNQASDAAASNSVTPTSAELLTLSAPLRHELKSPAAAAATGARRSSWCPPPVVRTIHPTPKSAAKAKELEVSPAECAAPARRELVSRTLGRVFGKSRSDV